MKAPAAYARQSVEKKDSLSIRAQLDLCQRTAGEGGGDEVMPVHTRTGDGGKETALRKCAAVRRDGGNFLFEQVAVAVKVAAHGGDDVLKRQISHIYASYFRREARRMASHTSGNESPIACPIWGTRLVGVMPGSVLASRQYITPLCSSKSISTRP